MVTVTISIVTGRIASQVSRITLGTLKPGASATVATSLTAPTQAGTYNVVAKASAWRDASTTNDSVTRTLHVTDSSGVHATASTAASPSTLSSTPLTSQLVPQNDNTSASHPVTTPPRPATYVATLTLNGQTFVFDSFKGN
jgi:hypothetical protein